MTDAVLADAQFGISKILRPFAGFEELYQGEVGSKPIAIPGTLDRSAGRQGFDNNLLAGIPVPMGSKIIVWLPNITRPIPIFPGARSAERYLYSFNWRLRNLNDFRSDRRAYHFPRQSLGENNQFVIPAAQKTVIYESSKQQILSQFFCVSETVQDKFLPRTFEQFAPLSPDSTLVSKVDAAYQQGIADIESNKAISFNAVQLDCEGDELIILVTKPPNVGNDTWDFDEAGDDKAFSDFFGSGTGQAFDNLGIYIFTGSNP